MKTRLPALALTLATLATGCVDNQASVQMVGVCGLPDEGCTFPSSCTAYYGGSYAWDVAVGTEMVLPVQVRNQVAPVTSPGVAVNTNDAKVTRTVTEYSVVGPALVQDPAAPAGTLVQLTIPRSTAYISEHVDAGGEGVVFAKPFSSATTAYLDALLSAGSSGTPPTPADSFLVLARMHLEGTYDNGSSFKTGELEIPINVCKGCVVSTATCTAPAVPVACPAVGQVPGTIGCK